MDVHWSIMYLFIYKISDHILFFINYLLFPCLNYKTILLLDINTKMGKALRRNNGEIFQKNCESYKCFSLFVFWELCIVTLHIRSNLLTYFKVHKIIYLTLGGSLYKREFWNLLSYISTTCTHSVFLLLRL